MWYSIHGALLPKSNKAVADASEALNWTYLLNFFFRVESSLELVLHLAVLGKKSNQPAFLEEKVIKYKVVSENYLPQRLSCLTVYYIMVFCCFLIFGWLSTLPHIIPMLEAISRYSYSGYLRPPPKILLNSSLSRKPGTTSQHSFQEGAPISRSLVFPKGKTCI